ncbi:MAG: patatin-like phospholipase family protein [Phenylobacterium sp.]|uniref:patatin-like phospholipase family protein n=1 Tax=Phenylobacterium sp. TaxID=1871053 RepID=UPI00391D5D82
MASTPKRSLFSTRLPAPPAGVRAEIAGFEGVRLTIDEAEGSLVAAADRLALPAPGAEAEAFDILAISGGAAGGAFGAGVLVGLTKARARPKFAIVTGVSTGALLAPFAFLGPEWDERLTHAYTGGYAAGALSLTRLAPAFGGGMFNAAALESLIDPFIDAALMEAVAREHALGRRLLVSTTDLDRQKTCMWDMGEIASRGGPQAAALFRDILVASASMPGIFPPRRFTCQADGVVYEEMHVDGGVAAPLFIMPEPLLRWHELGQRLAGGRIYVIVNTVLEQAPHTTHANLASILIRSFETMLRFSYRNALGAAATFCAAHGLPLSATAIEDDPANGSMLNFDTDAMRRIFDAAVERAQRPDLWSTPAPRPQDEAVAPD